MHDFIRAMSAFSSPTNDLRSRGVATALIFRFCYRELLIAIGVCSAVVVIHGFFGGVGGPQTIEAPAQRNFDMGLTHVHQDGDHGIALGKYCRALLRQTSH